MDSAYPNVTTISIPSWPPLLITNSSVTTSSTWARGMIATKFTAKVTTGLWFVYLTAKPAGTARMRDILIHDANRVALNPPQTVYLRRSSVRGLLLPCSPSSCMLLGDDVRENAFALLAPCSSNRMCLSTCPRASKPTAISTSNIVCPKSIGAHPFKHSPPNCDHVAEFTEIGFLVKDGIDLTHCKFSHL